MRAYELTGLWREMGWNLAEHEGFRVNSPKIDVTGILLAWLPSAQAIAEAARLGCTLLLAREQLNFPPDYSGALVDHQLSDRVTLPRVRAVIEKGIVVFRAQQSLDSLHREALAAALRLDGPADGLGLPIYTSRMMGFEIADRVWQELGGPRIRLVGNLDRPAQSIGLLHGSTGCGHNPAGLLPLLEAGVDLVIAGELDEYPMRAILDMDAAVIEVGQTASLAPGFRRLARLLCERFTGVPVHVYDMPKPWQPV